MSKFALYDKRTKTYFYALYSIRVIDRESYKFSKKQWECYSTVEDAKEKQEKLLNTIEKERNENIKYLDSYDTLREDIPKYKEQVRRLKNRFERLIVVEI